MIRTLYATLALGLISTPVFAEGPLTLESQIETADAQLFDAAFKDCRPDIVEALMLPEFEMYHDIDGLVAENRKSFIQVLESQCSKRGESGENEGYQNRREVVPGSRIIRRMGDWGALEEADHIFFEKRDTGWELVGGARYMHLWKVTEKGVKLSRSYSYDHGAPLAD